MKKISARQLEVMEILWESQEPLIASEIVSKGNLNINTVQAAIRSLLKKEYIIIDDIVYSGTVLTRRYRPQISKQEYVKEVCTEVKELSKGTLLMELLDEEKDVKVLEELDRLIQKKIKGQEE